MDDNDFTITDYIQRIEMWATAGSRAGQDAAAVSRAAQLYAAAVLVPVCGNAVQRLGTIGFDPDGFMLKSGSFNVRVLDEIRRIQIVGWLPEHHRDNVEIHAACHGVTACRTVAPATLFELDLHVELVAETEHQIRIALSNSFVPAAIFESTDARNLGCIMQSIRFT